MTAITWRTEKRKISDLKDYYKNPRTLSKDQAAQLKTSIERFGLIDKPIINTDNVIIGGHQRKNILKSLKIKEIDCNVPDRTLTDEEIEELNVRLNKNTGDWDFDILANQFDPIELVSWGFDPEELLGAVETIDEISLPNEEKEFNTMSFTLSMEQKELVERCLAISKDMGEFIETGNENSNGNALARICELWFGEYGRS